MQDGQKVSVQINDKHTSSEPIDLKVWTWVSRRRRPLAFLPSYLAIPETLEPEFSSFAG